MVELLFLPLMTIANAGGDAGSYLRCVLVAKNVWFISGIIVTDDADSTGAALITT